MSNDSFILESRGHAILRCGCTIKKHSITINTTYIANKTQERVMHLVYPGSGYILLYTWTMQDILLYPGYTAGRAGGANPAAGMERLMDLDVEQVGRLLDLEQVI